MTSGPYFQYWSSIIGFYVQVKFSADHSTQLLSPWFPGTLSCLGVCILPGQREALEVSVTLRDVSCIPRERCVLSHYPHSSKTQQLGQILQNNSNPLWPCCWPAGTVLLIRAQGHSSDMQGTCTSAPGTDMHWWLPGKSSTRSNIFVRQFYRVQ